jgi:hypothetical protein
MRCPQFSGERESGLGKHTGGLLMESPKALHRHDRLSGLRPHFLTIPSEGAKVHTLSRCGYGSWPFTD